MRSTSDGDPIQEMWGIDRKIARKHFGRKRKSTGFIFLPGSKFHTIWMMHSGGRHNDVWFDEEDEE